jgi:hypothetical protein
MSQLLAHDADVVPHGPGVGLRALGAAVLVAAAAGAVLSTTPAVDGPAHPGTRCEDRQVATAWLSDRCAADLFAEKP